MTEGVFNCLIDERRTLAFQSAIYNTVRAGDVVVDMGTGSGILAMLAAKAGAKKVYAIEYDENNIRTLENTFKLNGFADKIEVVAGDVTKVSLPEQIDVIIGEMIATGLIEELQVYAMNNILKYANKDCRVVLEKYDVYVELVQNQEEYYGFDFKIFRYEYPDDPALYSDAHTNKQIVTSVDFTRPVDDLGISKELVFTITKPGTINAVRLSAVTTLCDKSLLEGTFAYSYPIILPVETQIVKEGEVFMLKIEYELNGGMDKLKYKLTRK